MAKAAAYARYSSDQQEGHSIDTQFSKMDEVATENGDECIKRFQDEGVSGRTSDREQFMAMFREIKAGTLKSRKSMFKNIRVSCAIPRNRCFSKSAWKRSA